MKFVDSNEIDTDISSKDVRLFGERLVSKNSIKIGGISKLAAELETDIENYRRYMYSSAKWWNFSRLSCGGGRGNKCFSLGYCGFLLSSRFQLDQGEWLTKSHSLDLQPPAFQSLIYYNCIFVDLPFLRQDTGAVRCTISWHGTRRANSTGHEESGGWTTEEAICSQQVVRE